ncbi:MAG: GNAT family N-acetyltransferase, partial [Candidatus Bathyarchaeia archaeon]
KLKLGLEPSLEDIKLRVERYSASEGMELFLSYEDVKQDILIGFLRLRHPSEKAHRPEIREKQAMLVRELHVYGPMVPLSRRIKGGWQHRGYGERLLRRAEEISREEYDAKKILVTSGLGVKEYYFRRGYTRDGPYVSKKLD